ncbi:MAG: hypothetical protein IJ710_08975 [Prevotella sp.]|nr:hypothetical protein [Prevotella sp.]
MVEIRLIVVWWIRRSMVEKSKSRKFSKKPITEGGYTPEVTKQLNIAADNQMVTLLNRMEDMVSISRDLLRVLKDDTNETLNRAVDKLDS